MDEQAFALLIEPHRRALQLHCYRMLGSLHDADDALQETMLRAWKGSGRYEPRAQLGAWLHTIATNVCLTAIARRRARPTEVVEDLEYLQPYPDRLLEDLVVRETVELAFITAIQLLPPKQRAVLILRDVLGWSAKETAEALEDSVAAVNSALQRARVGLAAFVLGGTLVVLGIELLVWVFPRAGVPHSGKRRSTNGSGRLSSGAASTFRTARPCSRRDSSARYVVRCSTPAPSCTSTRPLRTFVTEKCRHRAAACARPRSWSRSMRPQQAGGRSRDT